MAEIQGADVVTIPGLSVSGDLSSKQYMAVKAASTANGVIAVAATTDIALGVLLDAPDASGEAATVAALGVVPMVAGQTTISFGDRIGYNTTGQATTANALTIGVALEDSAATGDYIKVLLTGLN